MAANSRGFFRSGNGSGTRVHGGCTSMLRTLGCLCYLCVCLGFIIPAVTASVGSSALDASTGRSLLQSQKGCPLSFESMNYSVFTTNCKGPNYPADRCCDALKRFACPFVDEINDVTNACATTMFSYINLNGNYPPGLFANTCNEGKLGLDCTTYLASSTPGATEVHSHCYLMIITSFLMLAWFLFI